MKESKERVSLSHAVPVLSSLNVQQDSTYLMALEEATRECRLAGLRISELGRQAVDTLLNLGKGTTYFKQE